MRKRSQEITPGLERSCAKDWVNAAPWQAGVQRIEAFFSGVAYAPHRHDTYSIGYTIHGVQSFDYRGARADSLPGQVMVLHPDEIHNGQAGTEDGFHYRMMYIEPSLLRNALGATAHTLPFVRDAVLDDPQLLKAIHSAFSQLTGPLEQIALDEIAVLLADGLLAHDQAIAKPGSALIDVAAVERALEFLNENLNKTVRSDQLESATGLDRYALARHFRRAFGTSPYRYLTMRRLDKARAKIARGATLAAAALEAGFSDQAHMSRQFKSTFGVAPGQWQKLVQSRDLRS